MASGDPEALGYLKVGSRGGAKNGLFPFAEVEAWILFQEEFLVLAATARGAAVACIVLVTALFVVSLWKEHRRMYEFRRAYELQYGEMRDRQVRASILVAGLVSDTGVKPASDRLSLLEKLSPDALDLTDWPLDRRMVAKYAVTPMLTLLSSFGKEIAVFLRGPS